MLPKYMVLCLVTFTVQSATLPEKMLECKFYLSKKSEINENTLQLAQEVIKIDLEKIKHNFVLKEHGDASTKYLWDNLEKNISDYFLEIKNTQGLRHSGEDGPMNLTNLSSGFQNLTNNFYKLIQGHSENFSNRTNVVEGTSKQGEKTLPEYLSAAFQGITELLQNIFQGNKGDGPSPCRVDDIGSAQPQTNPFSGIFNAEQSISLHPADSPSRNSTLENSTENTERNPAREQSNTTESSTTEMQKSEENEKNEV